MPKGRCWWAGIDAEGQCGSRGIHEGLDGPASSDEAEAQLGTSTIDGNRVFPSLIDFDAYQ